MVRWGGVFGGVVVGCGWSVCVVMSKDTVTARPGEMGTVERNEFADCVARPRTYQSSIVSHLISHLETILISSSSRYSREGQQMNHLAEPVPYLWPYASYAVLIFSTQTFDLRSRPTSLAPLLHNARPELLVLLSRHPHLVERAQARQYAATNPGPVLPLHTIRICQHSHTRIREHGL